MRTPQSTSPKKGDRVRPIESDANAPAGRVDWISKDGFVALVTWEDGSGCDQWGIGQLELVEGRDS